MARYKDGPAIKAHETGSVFKSGRTVLYHGKDQGLIQTHQDWIQLHHRVPRHPRVLTSD